MAKGTYYAWSTIQVGGERDKDTGALSGVKTINPGDSVSAADLDTDDEGFQQYVESGAVREVEYPEGVPVQMSVRDYARQQLQEAGEAVETTGGTWMLNESEQQNVARAAQMELNDAEEVKDEEVKPEDALQAKTPITEGKDLSLPKKEEEKKPASSTAQTTSASS